MNDKSMDTRNDQTKSKSSDQEKSPNRTLNASLAAEHSKNNQDLMRLTSLILIDAAMGYREMFWREDVEKHLDILLSDAKIIDQDTAATRKRIMDKAKGLNLNFKQKQEQLNKTAYSFIEDYTKHLSEAQYKAFENMRVAFGLMAEEIISSKDRTELLTVARLYNQGKIDFIFEHIKNKDNNEKNNGTTDGIDSNGTVQQEQQSTDTTNVIYNRDSGHIEASMDNGHVEGGKVQNGMVININGVEYTGGIDS